MLHKLDFMQPYAKHQQTCRYCMYGTDYKKGTDILSNINRYLQRYSANHQRCVCFNRFGTHLRTAQSGPDAQGKPGIHSDEANSVPFSLCLHLLSLAVLSIQNRT